MNCKNMVYQGILAVMLFITGLSNSMAAGPSTALHPSDPYAPVTADGQKIPVYISFRIINISNIDEVEQVFSVVGYLTAEWKDPRVTFTPSSPLEEFKIYNPGEIWAPDFNFANGAVPHTATDAILHAYPDGTVKYYERSSATLSNPFFLRTLPFDDQILKIVIQPFISQEHFVEFLPATEAATAEDGAYLALAEWYVTDLHYGKEKIEVFSNEWVSAVSIMIDVERRATFYIWKVILPLLLMVILSWTVLWIDPKDLNSQVQVSVTTILTVIAFSFAISASLPKVPYLTLIDTFFLICYFFVFVTAIEITTAHVLRCNEKIHKALSLQRVCRWALPTAFSITILLMVLNYSVL